MKRTIVVIALCLTACDKATEQMFDPSGATGDPAGERTTVSPEERNAGTITPEDRNANYTVAPENR